MAAKIVIKIKDEFFLQESTFTDPANAGKMVIGSNFPFQNSANAQNAENFEHLSGIFTVIKNAGNISESEQVFKNLISSISGLASNGKIESSFFVIDNTEAVNLMRMANDRSAYIGENLLNYYFIEVNLNDTDKIVNGLEELKKNKPNLGIDYIYVRGELVAFQQPVPQFGMASALPFHFDPNVFVPIEPEITPPKDVKFASKHAKKELQSFKVSNVAQTNSASNPVLQGQNSPSSQPPQIIKNITTVFENCGIRLATNPILTSPSSPKIKVIDIEQGWVFDSPITSYGLPPTSSKPILGGKVNNKSHELHGQKTLNVLIGRESPNVVDTLNGLCVGADTRVGSVWYTEGEYREAALASVLGFGYDKTKTEDAITDEITTTILKVGDIVLLELQIEKTYLVYPSDIKNPKLRSLFPVEIEPAMFEVIKKGVSAGFIIIEAAGNGNNNFDSVPYPPSNPKFKDLTSNSKGTGAIMVGALDNYSNKILNKGNRVDYSCFGSDVITSALIPPPPFPFSITDPLYSNAVFNSTSLASAIVAALVAIFQNEAKKPSLPSGTTGTKFGNRGGVGRRLKIAEIKKLLTYLSVPTPPVLPDFKSFLNKNSIY